MESVKYIGLDAHQSSISVAVVNGEGKLIMRSVIVTKANAVVDLLKGLRGVLHVTFEEGTHSGGWPSFRARVNYHCIGCPSLRGFRRLGIPVLAVKRLFPPAP